MRVKFVLWLSVGAFLAREGEGRGIFLSLLTSATVTVRCDVSWQCCSCGALLAGKEMRSVLVLRNGSSAQAVAQV